MEGKKNFRKMPRISKEKYDLHGISRVLCGSAQGLHIQDRQRLTLEKCLEYIRFQIRNILTSMI